MPISRTVTYTRPSTSVSFYPPIRNSVIWNYITETYIDTGKIISNSDSFSPDGLTRTSVTIFDSEQSRDQYVNDTTVQSSKFVTNRRIYHDKTDILVNIVDQST